MLYTRRDMGRIVAAAGLASTRMFGATKPDSKIKGVQIGAITYSYRSMPDQSAEATLKYCVDSGISAIELMAPPITDWMRKKGNFAASPAAAAAAAASAAGGGGRGGGGGARGGSGGRGGGFGGGGARVTYPVVAGMKVGFGNDQPAGQWNGKACPAGRGGLAGGPGGPGAAGGSGARGGGGGFAGGGGRGQQTPEQIAAADAERKWRLGLSMDIFRDLRKMYNDAGVTIYAIKDLPMTTDDDLEQMLTIAKTLGASHFTSELPAGANADATLKRLGDAALKHGLFSAYHSHQQGSMTAFDEALEISKGNRANVDLGHFMAATNPGGTPLEFLNKFHDKIASFHIKDRTTVAHCALNLPWGTGETPIAQILQTVQKNKWTMPASIELEYDVPEGSDAVKEVAICLDFCRKALA